MVSSSGTSSGSSQIANSGSEENLQALMSQRKQKRMLSNRESARRSRQRKQKHLDDLLAQVNQLRKENGQILAALNVTTQHYLGVEGENSVLRTQMAELSSRLQALNEILHHMNRSSSNGGGGGNELFMLCDAFQSSSDSIMSRPWSLMAAANQLPIMASADMFQYS